MSNILAPITALSVPDAASVNAEAASAVSFLDRFVITEQAHFETAADQLKGIKAKAKTLEERRTAITGPLNAAVKAVNDLFRAPAEALTKAEGVLKGKMLTWTQEQQRIADERTRKAREEAEAIRKEAERQAAELAAKAAEESAKSGAAMDDGDDVMAGLAAARAQRAQDDAAAATQVAVTPVAVLPYMPPKTQGISASKKLDFEVTSLHALVTHIAEHPELLSLVAADQVRLRAYVKGLGLSCSLPGVRVFETTVMSARA
jgi:hypothetical protein